MGTSGPRTPERLKGARPRLTGVAPACPIRLSGVMRPRTLPPILPRTSGATLPPRAIGEHAVYEGLPFTQPVPDGGANPILSRRSMIVSGTVPRMARRSSAFDVPSGARRKDSGIERQKGATSGVRKGTRLSTDHAIRVTVFVPEQIGVWTAP